jgi:hypothetical protein
MYARRSAPASKRRTCRIVPPYRATSKPSNRQHQSCLSCYSHPFTTSKIYFILSQSLPVLCISPQLLNASLLDIHTHSQAPRRAQTLLSCHLPSITMSLLNHEFRLRLAIAATRSINGLPSDYTPMKQQPTSALKSLSGSRNEALMPRQRGREQSGYAS